MYVFCALRTNRSIDAGYQLGKEEEAATTMANRGMVEFRETMSDSLAFVREIFEEEHTYQTNSLEQSTANLSMNRGDGKLAEQTFPKSIPYPESICSPSMHFFSPALVVLLNVIACRFLSVLKKQVYLSQVVSRRTEMELEQVRVVVHPSSRVSRVYTIPRRAAPLNESYSLYFRPSEMWELIQTEVCPE